MRNGLTANVQVIVLIPCADARRDTASTSTGQQPSRSRPTSCGGRCAGLCASPQARRRFPRSVPL